MNGNFTAAFAASQYLRNSELAQTSLNMLSAGQVFDAEVFSIQEALADPLSRDVSPCTLTGGSTVGLMSSCRESWATMAYSLCT